MRSKREVLRMDKDGLQILVRLTSAKMSGEGVEAVPAPPPVYLSAESRFKTLKTAHYTYAQHLDIFSGPWRRDRR